VRKNVWTGEQARSQHPRRLGDEHVQRCSQQRCAAAGGRLGWCFIFCACVLIYIETCIHMYNHTACLIPINNICTCLLAHILACTHACMYAYIHTQMYTVYWNYIHRYPPQRRIRARAHTHTHHVTGALCDCFSCTARRRSVILPSSCRGSVDVGGGGAAGTGTLSELTRCGA